MTRSVISLPEGPRPSRAVRALLLVGAVGVALLAAALLLDRGVLSAAWWDRWPYAALGTLAAGLLLARARTGGRGAGGWAALGVGQLLANLSDWLYAATAHGITELSMPSVFDVLWLAAYPCYWLGIVLLLRAEADRYRRSTALDGLIAGLSACALASLAFGPVLAGATGDRGDVLTLMAYPVGDVVLVTLLIAALALQGGGWRGPWALLAAGFALCIGADIAYLLLAASGTYLDGSPVDALWPLSGLLLAAAAWTRTAPRSAARDGVRLLVVPAVVTTCSLLVLLAPFAGLAVPPLSAALAAAALLAVAVRTALTFREVAELAETRRLAATDELTGLPNRRHLYRELQQALDRRRPGDRLALLMLDLDRFKEVNDALGHGVGDDLLRQVADRLAGRLRAPQHPADSNRVGVALLARLGGDEFAVLLDGADQAAAERTARDLRDALLEPFALSGLTLHVDVSIGVALCPDAASTRTDLLRCADTAMYDAKRTHTGHAVYSSAGGDHRPDRLLLSEQLRAAIPAGQLVCHYQPKADLRTGTIIGVEALVRWEHPQRGLLAPDAFLALAEQAGLIKPLTAVVLEQAVAQCRAWHDTGRPLTVAVNLSVTSLLDVDLPRQVSDALTRHHLPAAALELEITENVLMADPARAAETVDRLRALGVAVSVDDYGTGYSSLAYLRRLHLDELKLDRAFITGLGADDRDTAIVRSTIDLAHALGLRIVAEGVETADDWHLLTRLGCDQAQGYYLSRPVPADVLTAMVPTDSARAGTPGTRRDIHVL